MKRTKGDEILEQVRDAIRGVLRDSVETFSDAMREDEEDKPLPPDALVGDWVLLIQFVELDGDSGYFRLSSPGMSDHARTGLVKELYDRC